MKKIILTTILFLVGTCCMFSTGQANEPVCIETRAYNNEIYIAGNGVRPVNTTGWPSSSQVQGTAYHYGLYFEVLVSPSTTAQDIERDIEASIQSNGLSWVLVDQIVQGGENNTYEVRLTLENNDTGSARNLVISCGARLTCNQPPM